MIDRLLPERIRQQHIPAPTVLNWLAVLLPLTALAGAAVNDRFVRSSDFAVIRALDSVRFQRDSITIAGLTGRLIARDANEAQATRAELAHLSDQMAVLNRAYGIKP